MLVKPDRTLVTAADVVEYLADLLCAKRHYPIENDWQWGYERALNDVTYRLIYSSPKPEGCTGAECVVEGLRLMTIEAVLDYLFCEVRDMGECPPGDDFLQGYERALKDLMYQLWLSSPESAKSRYIPPKMPESCTEGAKVIDLDDVRRNRRNQGPNVTKDDVPRRSEI
jgi:hypothetical protein